MATEGRVEPTSAAVGSGDAEPPSDSALLERIRGGDHAAMDILVKEYWGPIHRYSQGIVGSPEVGEDVAQETFRRLWSRRGEWRPTSCRALLYRIARNLSLNHRASRETHRRLLEGLWRSGPRSPPTPDQVLEGRELRDAVERAMKELPDRRREVLTLVRFHGMSYREAAETLEISPQTVANHMSAALSALRSALRAHLDPVPTRRPDPPSPAEAQAGRPSLRLLP